MCDRSLKCRVLTSLLIVLIAGFSALALHFYDVRDQLRRSIMLIQAQEIGADFTASSAPDSLPTHHNGSQLSYSLYSASNELLWYSPHLQKPLQLRAGSLQEDIELIRTTVRGSRGFVVNVPVQLDDGATLMVAKEDTLERQLIDNLLHQRTTHGVLLAIPLSLLSIGLLYILLRWTVRPIQTAAKLAEAIGPNDPDQRIPLEKLPREVLPLARAANVGLERLSQAYAYERKLVSDAAHALRTPLAVLSLRLQKCRDEGKADWPAIDQEFGRLQKLISQLLALAHQDRAQENSNQTADLSKLARICREAAGSMLPLFEQNNRSIELHLEQSPLVYGNTDLLREAIRNALENALHHGIGQVTMSLTAEHGDTVHLEIKDEGTGVPLLHQEHMFQRFHKGYEGSPGAGLGLAIIRSTLRNIGGDARFISERPCVLRLQFKRAI